MSKGKNKSDSEKKAGKPAAGIKQASAKPTPPVKKTAKSPAQNKSTPSSKQAETSDQTNPPKSDSTKLVDLAKKVGEAGLKEAVKQAKEDPAKDSDKRNSGSVEESTASADVGADQHVGPSVIKTLWDEAISPAMTIAGDVGQAIKDLLTSMLLLETNKSLIEAGEAKNPSNLLALKRLLTMQTKVGILLAVLSEKEYAAKLNAAYKDMKKVGKEGALIDAVVISFSKALNYEVGAVEEFALTSWANDMVLLKSDNNKDATASGSLSTVKV